MSVVSQQVRVRVPVKEKAMTRVGRTSFFAASATVHLFAESAIVYNFANLDKIC